MGDQATVNKALPQLGVRGEASADAGARAAQFRYDAIAVGHQDDVAAANVAQVGAEVRLEVANANGLHAGKCGS